MIKIEYYRKEAELMIFNRLERNNEQQFEFLGNMTLRNIADVFLELDGPIARPKFGSLLYQAAAMIAHEEDKYLCLPRDGAVRTAAEKPMKDIEERYGNTLNAIEVPEIFNEELYDFTNEDDAPHFFKAYKIEPTEAVKNCLSIMDSKSETKIPKKILDEWSDFFRIAYDTDSNKFLDKDYELIKELDVSDYVAFDVYKEKPSQKKRARLKP